MVREQPASTVGASSPPSSPVPEPVELEAATVSTAATRDLSPDTPAAAAVEGNDTSSHDPAVAEQECAESLAASLQRQQPQRAAMDWDTAGPRLPGEDLPPSRSACVTRL